MVDEVQETSDLADALPDWAKGLRGRLRRDVSLARRCWFQVGGPAEWLFTPEDTMDLCVLMQQRPNDLPLTILGVGSNLLVRDGGIPGIVVRLGRGFTEIAPLERSPYISAGAGALDLHVATVAKDAALCGLEFLSGIPGTIGGALKMNAGAYGREIKDVLVEAELVDERGDIHRVPASDLGLSYRRSNVPEGWIFTSAVFEGAPGDREMIAERMQQIAEERDLTQPVKSRTGGSTFKNPEGDQKAWQLIDAAGCRGLTVGNAQVSEKHCNFLINLGGASAADLEVLGETVRQKVQQHSDVLLQWEIKRIGEALV